MQNWKKVTIAGAGLAMAAGAALVLPGLGGMAADHLDPPARTDPSVDSTPDRAADIADLYAFHTDSSVVLALTFAGLQATSEPATYDRDVLYTINISNAGERTDAEIPLRIRFAPGDADGTYGVQVENLPGVTGTLMFDSTRDFFAGQNLTAVVIEIPRDRIANGANPIDVWATTARFGGQL